MSGIKASVPEHLVGRLIGSFMFPQLPASFTPRGISPGKA